MLPVCSNFTQNARGYSPDSLARLVLGRFDPKWRDHFEQSTDEEIKAAVDSVVNNRNQVSHGRQVGISLVRFGEYYGSLKPFLMELDAFIDGQ
jgi:hypothetical protein